ncbi:FixH [Novipirellula aureliae]|uniref:FixH n=1 Tax=Novipirellula aureliae TaxID=2527966 RepID=A0A5C6E8E1_9BACT|nr:FixH family protein [Novipirellula aureliae]TWU45232.1 FixH [Novipirellula aureliae]
MKNEKVSRESNRIANHKAALRWGGFVVALLTVQVLVGVYAIYLASGDPSVAALPNYYENALNWDEKVKAEAFSRELGWTLVLGAIEDGGTVGLQGKLTDKDGSPVSIASGTIELYHHARASEIDQIRLKPSSEGTFGIVGCLPTDGLWQVNGKFTNGDGTEFVDSRVLMVHSSNQRSTPQGG